jgi:hypothetical protein
MYFGGRTLTEPLAAHLLIMAVLIAAPGTSRRSALVLGGFLAAAALVIRMQLAPAIALLWLWPPVGKQRLLFLTGGAMLGLAADAVLDTLTWGMPLRHCGRISASILSSMAPPISAPTLEHLFRFMATIGAPAQCRSWPWRCWAHGACRSFSPWRQ